MDSITLFLGVLVNLFIVGALTEYPSVKKEGYTESKTCSACHTDIYNEWKNSLHASSISDPVFLGVFNEVEKEDNRRFCLKCHAPTVLVTGDYDLTQPITKEGVTCDFCHTVKNVDLSKEKPFELAPGPVKRGPFKSDSEKGHKNLYSEIHLTAEFCAGCHEVVNEKGFHVFSTYTEWKEGPYATKGVICQNCHMPEEFGVSVVNPEIASSEHVVTAHKFLGGHSQINIATAATMSQFLDRVDDYLTVVLYVTNAEAGHSLPTGIPSRKVILTVRVLNSKGDVLGEKEVEYRRVLLDEEGKEIPADNIKGMFLEAAALKSDNRIKPKETRREEFRFPITEGMDEALEVESTLVYEFRVPYLEPNRMRVEMARARSVISVEKVYTSPWIWVASFGALLVLLFALLIGLRSLRR